MANDIIPLDLQIPTHLADRVGKPSVLGDSLGGGISGGGAEFPRISIKGSRFRLIDGGAESVLDTNALEVVIVGANPGLSKAWYASAWNPDAEPTAPDCYSLEGDKPHPDSTQPQNDICAGCPQNAWGSRITPQGTKVKACADKKRLAVVSADDAGGPIYLLEVTASALKGLNKYNTGLKMRNIPTEVVRTIVSFDTDASYPKIEFGFGGLLTEEVQSKVDPLFGSAQVIEITGTASTTSAVAPVAAPVVKLKVIPAPETPPAPVTPPSEPVAEKKATGFGAATVVAGAEVPEAPKEVAEEPTAAPVAEGTAGLATEIENLMKEVADDV
jgi:hypothetical protein